MDWKEASPEVKLLTCIFDESVLDALLHDSVEGKGLHQALMEALDSIAIGPRNAKFRDRCKRVICLRFGLEDGRFWSLREIGPVFGVTGERIRQIEAKALRMLRHPARKRILQPFFK